MSGNVYGPDVVLKRIQQIRDINSPIKIVFTNGCFDVLHVGHLSLLEGCRANGIVVVALNSDESVKMIKGPERPYHTLVDRMRMVSAFRCVDFVTYFEEETPLELILKLKPDILIKGGDYQHEDIVGASEVTGWGGKVLVAPRIPGHSTTDILKMSK